MNQITFRQLAVVSRSQTLHLRDNKLPDNLPKGSTQVPRFLSNFLTCHEPNMTLLDLLLANNIKLVTQVMKQEQPGAEQPQKRGAHDPKQNEEDK